MEYNKRYEVRSMNSINFYDPERGTWNVEPGTRNVEHRTFNAPPFSRTPTSKIHVFCNQHQVGGRHWVVCRPPT
jgi:hypothetical protein